MTFLVVAILAEMLQKNIERKTEGGDSLLFRSDAVYANGINYLSVLYK